MTPMWYQNLENRKLFLHKLRDFGHGLPTCARTKPRNNQFTMPFISTCALWVVALVFCLKQQTFFARHIAVGKPQTIMRPTKIINGNAHVRFVAIHDSGSRVCQFWHLLVGNGCGQQLTYNIHACIAWSCVYMSTQQWQRCKIALTKSD